jgi:uncharacterized SAM-binding protein YcdF (DUF218 family)
MSFNYAFDRFVIIERYALKFMTNFSRTTIRKVATSMIIVVGIIFGGYILYVATILMWSSPKNIESHDAIIVLTGSKGRIETGFGLLLDDKAPRMLISGVQNNTTFDDLITANITHLNDAQITLIRHHCCIELDYIADTTATNAIETAKWIKANNIQKFILVTSVSHMPRAYLQFHNTIDNKVGITPYPHREGKRLELVMTPSFWHYAAREYFKFVGSLIQLELL